MTPHQRKVLDFVRDEIELRGDAPGLQRIANHLGLRARSSAHRLVDALVRDGLLVRRGAGRSVNLHLPGADLRSVPTRALLAELARRETSRG